MNIQQNVSLKPFNTFGIAATAEQFVSLSDAGQLKEITALPVRKHVLGGGSNILLTQNVAGLVVQNVLKGIKVIRQDDTHVWLDVAAGEVWHEFVMFAISNGWSGIENLALIPGTVGASPMQNIGAYGVEARETIEQVTFWLWDEQVFTTYSNAECSFGYRDSVFKHHLKEKAFITSVVYRLNKIPHFNTTYGAIGQELEHMGVTDLSAKAIAQAVINIRTGKLPDPKQIGNAGSFFKNPTISKTQFDTLHLQHPDIPSYPVNETTVKVPAAWLIEKCGWKGYRSGDIGVHTKQALVLVNYGNGQGSDLWKLSGDIVASVNGKFGIELEREVNIW